MKLKRLAAMLDRAAAFWRALRPPKVRLPREGSPRDNVEYVGTSCRSRSVPLPAPA